MQKRFIWTLLFAGIFSIAMAGIKIPAFSLQDVNNKTRHYKDIKGEKLTIIDFWATWCKPCVRAIPKLSEIYHAYKQKGVSVLGISVDSPRNAAKIKPFVKIHRMDYPVLKDPQAEVSTRLNVTVYPTLFIVNSANEIVYTHYGFRSGDEKILIKEIEKILGNAHE